MCYMFQQESVKNRKTLKQIHLGDPTPYMYILVTWLYENKAGKQQHTVDFLHESLAKLLKHFSWCKCTQVYSLQLNDGRKNN